MRVFFRRGRTLLAALVIATALASSSCGGSPSQPTPAPTPKSPPACSVKLWACSGSGYGAIAYSPSTHASGISYNWATRAEAETSAIGYCANADCAIAAWFQNSCGAIATAPTGEMATGTGTTGDTAQAFALGSCLTR